MNAALADILHRAAQLMLDFQSPKVFDKGHHADFVTEADLAVQEFLLEELAKAFPAAKFLAEEGEGQRLTDGLTFIIDPIDGTTNYFRRRRSSMISIGAVEGREPVFGAIYDPYRDEMYHAEKGRGAFCNEARLHVSEEPFSRAVIGFGTAPYYEELFEVTARTMREILPKIADFRRTGSACLDMCDVAAGRSDGHFEWRLQPWDYCAATLLVEEAGGRCGNILGGPVTYDRGIPHMAASKRIFEEFQAALQSVWKTL
ncbi:MAG: inositol monophosphatase [Clostridia bacterium]|nr:inositol monophosphatase [Clostridia bacterium]